MNTKIWYSALKDRRYRKIEASQLFDRHWYLTTYPDVAAAGVDPLTHYLEFGAKEGRNPAQLFFGDWYLGQNPSVAASGNNPLLHFIETGALEGLNPHPLFFTEWYLKQYPDVARAGINPLRHYLSNGWREGRDPNPVFDSSWYLTQNPDVAGAGVNPLCHYVSSGAAEGRDPHPLFHTTWYRHINADVAADGLNPLWHYLHSGAREGRDPNQHFDTDWYRARYPDATGAQTNALLDYLEHGVANDRDPSPEFWGKWYLERYPDVAEAGVNPLVHYLAHGIHEGRRPNSIPAAPPDTILAPIKHETWRPNEGPEWIASFKRRLQERMSALRQMNLASPLSGGRPTFSITSTVYDTRPSFLRELASTIRDQAFKDFEWLILDNGSTDRATIAALADIAASDKRFKLFSVEENLHIIGGNRFLFEKVNGHYVVPVDSDDVLYKDSLALFADTLRDSSRELPCLIFSDEHRIRENGEPFDLLWRWEYTFAHAMATVPAAHLMAFSAELGKQVGVYTDDDARGSHDWDTLLRITELGGRTVHVPEVLYGWRMHKASTAGSVGAKDYIENSQSKVLQASLKRRNLDQLFSFRPLFGSLGWYHPKRKPISIPAVELVFILGVPETDLQRLEHNLRITSHMNAKRRVLFAPSRNQQVEVIQSEYSGHGIEWVACNSDAEVATQVSAVDESLFARVVISSNLRVRDEQGVLDSIGVLELDKAAAVVSGAVLSEDGLLLNAGMTDGIGRFVGSPFYGWPRGQAPAHLWRITRRVTAAPTFYLTIRADIFSKVGGIGGIDIDDAIHGLDFCTRCSDAGYTIVYAPSMVCYRQQAMVRSIGEGTSFRAKMGASPSRDRLPRGNFSSHLSRLQERFGFLASSNESSTIAGLDYEPFRPAIPLNLVVDADLNNDPAINVLLPAVRMASMSGGPNTALNLAYRLAKEGFSVRIIATDLPLEEHSDIIVRHMRSLTGINESLPVQISSAYDRTKPFSIGANDIFLATAWWTAQMAKYASALVGGRPFVYMIQDFEPILYAASSLHVQALESYSLDHIPVINTEFLKGYLTEYKVGKFADPAFAAEAISFEPSVARSSFYIEEHERPKKRLLFYARPTTAQRNLFDIGVAALRAAIDLGYLSPVNWTFVGMGEQFSPVDLGNGAVLECAPWLGFDDYAEQMRQSEILLSLMASPHPSYPPYEMAACGGLVVTNTYANKTRNKLAQISENIIGASPTIEGVTSAIQEAVQRLDDVTARRNAAEIGLPASWDDVFAEVIPGLKGRLAGLGLRLSDAEGRLAKLPDPGAQQPVDALVQFLAESVSEGQRRYDVPQLPGLLSFVTTVWNTPPEFMEILVRSLKAQHGGTNFEWFILDNGSTNAGTLQFLGRLSREEFVHLERVEDNLGIVGGMRYCLERASGKYIVPLDSDDYLFPQAVQAVTWCLQRTGYPPLLHTDETLLSNTTFHTAYLKPDWDPVLFVNSCYIAHLGVIDRALALKYDVYGDARTEGSHDWDTFTRFMNAGHSPVHLPEILYAWRIHDQSTSGNISSKPFVFDSQRAVLSKFLAAQPKADLFELQKSPLFDNTPDWWLRRRRTEPRAVTTFLIRSKIDGERRRAIHLPVNVVHHVAGMVDHRVVEFDFEQPISDWLPFIQQCIAEDRLIHLLARGAQPDDDEWLWEATGLLELFPHTVMVGGRLKTHNTILSAGCVFGFDDGCGCPDRGRSVADPGYFAQMWKPHSVNAVSAQHAVVRPEFLLDVISALKGVSHSVAYLGQWCGGIASRRGMRVIYSPFLSAETTVDWDALVSPEEKSHFRDSFADLLAKPPLVSPYLGRTRERAYLPIRHEARVAHGSANGSSKKPLLLKNLSMPLARTAATGEGSVTFSILTTLYIGTDAELFKKTAESVLRQQSPGFEWCVLAHGPISRKLQAVLRRLGRDSRIKIKQLPDNRGITGGMRFVLEQATGEYVVPLDGDDLLSEDCLQVLAQAISRHDARPAYLYSDEDIVIGSDVSSPYLRPPWDPVLDLENSWIWHVTAFQRKAAIELGVYTDPGTEYCHDWDTVSRFARAGYQPVHVPEILYHWRHHAGSTSNSESPTQGSAASTRHLLTRKISERGLSEVCEIVPYPINRGALEWWIRRKPVDMPAIRRIVLVPGDSGEWAPAASAELREIPFSSRGLEELRSHAASLADTDVVMFVSADVHVSVREEALSEAVKILEFCSDVAVVSGRVVSEDRVVVAGSTFDRLGTLHAPYDDKPVSDPGHYALAWKSQCIAVPILDLCFLRAATLKAALEALPSTCSFSELALWLGAFARANGKRIAYSPLISAELHGAVLRKSYPRDDSSCWEAFTQYLAADGQPSDLGPRHAQLQQEVSV